MIQVIPEMRYYPQGLDQNNLTIADWQLLGQAYSNLIDAGLLIGTTEYDDFVEAVMTGRQTKLSSEFTDDEFELATSEADMIECDMVDQEQQEGF